MHETLRVDRRERVDDLLVYGRPEGHDREHLRLTSLEKGRAVRTREDAHLDRERADLGELAAVRPDPLLDNRSADLLLEEALEREVDILLGNVPAFAHQRADGLALQLIDAGLARRLVGVSDLSADPVREERGDTRFLRRVDFFGLPFHLGLPRGAYELVLRLDGGEDPGLREAERLEQQVFAHLLRAGLDHHDRVACAGDDEVKVARLELLDRGVQGETALDPSDTHAADGPVERRG